MKRREWEKICAFSSCRREKFQKWLLFSNYAALNSEAVIDLIKGGDGYRAAVIDAIITPPHVLAIFFDGSRGAADLSYFSEVVCGPKCMFDKVVPQNVCVVFRGP